MVRGIRGVSSLGLGAFLAMLFLAVTTAALSAQGTVRVVGDDRGGPVGARALEIGVIRAAGQRVEIRGRICYSACTLYLGAGDVCVSPSTEFGFHGPSASDGALDPAQFERWSQLMGSFYNEPLHDWFMQRARYEQGTILRLSGTELIRLGYRAC